MIVSKWNDRRLRVGWTIRLRNGKLAVVTWVHPDNGHWECYTAKVIENDEGKARVAREFAAFGESIGLGEGSV